MSTSEPQVDSTQSNSSDENLHAANGHGGGVTMEDIKHLLGFAVFTAFLGIVIAHLGYSLLGRGYILMGWIMMVFGAAGIFTGGFFWWLAFSESSPKRDLNVKSPVTPAPEAHVTKDEKR